VIVGTVIEVATERSRPNHFEFRGSMESKELEASERLISNRASPLRSAKAAATTEMRESLEYFSANLKASSGIASTRTDPLWLVQLQESVR
jgi:hypothetical protein